MTASAASPVAAPAGPALLRGPVAFARAEGSPKSGARQAPVSVGRRREAPASKTATTPIAGHVHAGVAPAVFAAASSVRPAPGAPATRSIPATTGSNLRTRAGGDGAQRDSAGSSAATAHEKAAEGAGSTAPSDSPARASGPSFSAPLRSHGGAVTPGTPESLPRPAPSASAPAGASVPSPARSLHELAAADPSLNAAAIGKDAHLRLDTGRAGDLTMHLRINDGVADIEVGGAAAGKLGMLSLIKQ
jgi:hypothetical protein